MGVRAVRPYELFVSAVGITLSEPQAEYARARIEDAGLGEQVEVVAVALGEGLGAHIPKGYVYFAMAFSVGVEMLNIRYRKKTERT